ncbi:uncharacterized protein LOC117783308 [Drosophila innubila]|uniref:uncharacterized protein LOC117783308 n=1 Tax=Drosophila innubila TaxID=198719 RepID=UPI00148D0FF4|nr:uncharacterized protein LOC117783308 [Drosophila innubila]
MDQQVESGNSVEVPQLNQSQLEFRSDGNPAASRSNLADKLKTLEKDELQTQAQMEYININSLEDLTAEQLQNETDLKEKPVEQKTELEAEAQPEEKQLQLVGSENSTEQRTYVNQLIEDISLPRTEISEGILTSDEESETSDRRLLINFEAEDRNSVDSYTLHLLDPLTNSQQQLQSLPLNESYSLMDKIDMSGVLDGSNNLYNSTHLEDKLLSVMQNQDNWDIKVYIGENKFYCQFVILQMFCSTFLHCKVEDTYVIRLPENMVTAQAFNIIYKWMLQEKPTEGKSLSNRCLFEIYKTAEFLGIAELVDSICNTLDMIKIDNEVYSLLPDMSNVDLPDFEYLFLSRISRFFLTLVSSLEFVEMSPKYIKNLLSSHYLGVNSEIEVFYALVRWFSHNWPQRQIHVPNLVGGVRFGLLPPMFLRFLQNPQSTRVMHFITSVPEVKDMINKAFVFASAELYCKDLICKDQMLCQLPDYNIPEPRKWIFDRKCPYHHNLICSQRQFFTYDQFLVYLETLHHTKPSHWKRLKYLEDGIICCPR